MAKKGMSRPNVTHTKERNTATVPEIQGKAKSRKIKANPIIAGTNGATLKVYHERAVSEDSTERPISNAYPAIDNDLARDNMEIDIPEADLQDI